jgi:hypothetical protein
MMRILFASALCLALADAFSTNMPGPLLRSGGSRASACPINLKMSEGRPLQRNEVLGMAGVAAAGIFLAPGDALARKQGSDGTWAKHIGKQKRKTILRLSLSASYAAHAYRDNDSGGLSTREEIRA